MFVNGILQSQPSMLNTDQFVHRKALTFMLEIDS
ncbi:hypothetical protein T11_1765 [Trichinella zimbabwensis]|uniref:Uncharacterized protein n=1 Tax=Trichinella zimbabwensis TaxID=268475 RepID=A0A0V1GM77_9BILA|nr:hypothetical protein T11_1765 [Trichinella zimbabwensis]